MKMDTSFRCAAHLYGPSSASNSACFQLEDEVVAGVRGVHVHCKLNHYLLRCPTHLSGWERILSFITVLACVDAADLGRRDPAWMKKRKCSTAAYQAFGLSNKLPWICDREGVREAAAAVVDGDGVVVDSDLPV